MGRAVPLAGAAVPAVGFIPRLSEFGLIIQTENIDKTNIGAEAAAVAFIWIDMNLRFSLQESVQPRWLRRIKAFATIPTSTLGCASLAAGAARQPAAPADNGNIHTFHDGFRGFSSFPNDSWAAESKNLSHPAPLA